MKRIGALLCIICMASFIAQFVCGYAGSFRGSFFVMLWFMNITILCSLMILGLILIKISSRRIDGSRHGGRLKYSLWIVLSPLSLYIVFVSMPLSLPLGRDAYFYRNKSRLENVARKLLSKDIAQGRTIIRVASADGIKYPIYVYENSNTGLRAVIFSHWLAPPARDAGWVYVQAPTLGNAVLTELPVEAVFEVEGNWCEYQEMNEAMADRDQTVR